jgi:cytochrome P450
MTENAVTDKVKEIDFFDPKTNDCPYHAYKHMRAEEPVWKDPKTGMFVLTRYEDIRTVLLDNDRFKNTISTQTVGEIGLADDASSSQEQFEAQEVNSELANLYAKEGWDPGPALNARDEPEHLEVRKALFEPAFRRASLEQFDPLVSETVHETLDRCVVDGRCEFVNEFAAPMTLAVVMKYLGIPLSDLNMVKDMTHTWIGRAGLMSNPENDKRAAHLEIEFQKYSQGLFDRLREQPDETFLSRIVNTEIPEWGRKLTDEELHGFLTTDMMVGGGETTTGSLAAGMMILAEDQDLFERLASDPDRYLETFVEEVVRLESPVQGMFRQTAVETEFDGIKVPKGAVLQLRYASANRDERRYEDSESLDMERANPRGHLGFGTGKHICLGATLARREMYHTFEAVIERYSGVTVVTDAPPLRWRPNYIVRCLEELHVEFTPRVK